MAQVQVDQKLKRTTKNSFSSDTLDAGTSISTRLRQRIKDNQKKSVVTVKEKKTMVSNTPQIVTIIDCIEIDDSSVDEPLADKKHQETSVVIKSTHKTLREKGFPCSICGKIVSSSQRLKEHLNSHTGEKHLECKTCGKRFAWRHSLKSHMATHNKDNPNICSICGKKYCNKSSVKYHMYRVHGNPRRDFKCETCGKDFITKADLDRHSFYHSSEKPFICEYCGKSFRFKSALSVHYRSHSGEKPYKCGFCDKSFIHLSSVIGHRRRHTGEMPYDCTECGKRFRVKRALNTHMLVHTEKRPFKCEQCGKTFRSRSGYHVHLDFHLGIKRHMCKFCGRAFRAWCNMHKHMKRHIGEKPHKCEICGKSFIEKQELKTHIKCHNSSDQKSTKPLTNPISESSHVEEIISPDLICSSSNMCAPTAFGNSEETNAVMTSHIDLPDPHPVMYDCTATLEKCTTEKCQLLPDAYNTQFLYQNQQPAAHYTSQSTPNQNIYFDAQPGQLSNRSCISSINSASFCCPSLNSQNYNGFSFNLPSSDGLLIKCKLCRSFFHSSLVLKSHLMDYHRIDEENIDEFMS